MVSVKVNEQTLSQQEVEFFDFLNNGKAQVYTLRYKDKDAKFNKDVTLTKVIGDNTDCVLLYELPYYTKVRLEETNAPKDIKYFGEYVPSQNALTIRYSWEAGNLEDLLSNINVFIYNEVVEKLVADLESEFAKRRDKFRLDFSNWTKYENAFEEYNERFKRAVIKDDIEIFVKKEYVDMRAFNEENFNNYVRQYITDKDKAIVSLCDTYEAITGSRVENRHIDIITYGSFYEDAMIDPTVRKGHVLNKLFKETLGDAKNVWAILKDGNKVKVETYLDLKDLYTYNNGERTVEENALVLGRWGNEVNIKNVESIQYGRKTYNIDEMVTSWEVETGRVRHEVNPPLFQIEGADVVYVTERRIRDKNRHDNLYYYSMRHGDSNWGQALTIELGVTVNFFGVIVTSSPIPSLENARGRSDLPRAVIEIDEDLRNLIYENL